MGSAELMGAFKADFQAEVDAAQAKVVRIDELSAAVAAEIVTANKAGFEEGLNQANQAGGSDKIYSDAEMNQIIAEETAPLKAKIAELEVAVANLQAAIEPAKAEAVAAFKAELAAKYAEQQVVESTSETGFAELLK